MRPLTVTGIVRYDASSTADPTTTDTVETSSNCGDVSIHMLTATQSID